LLAADIEYAKVACDDYVDKDANEEELVCLSRAEILTSFAVVPIDVLGNVANIREDKKEAFKASINFVYPNIVSSIKPTITEMNKTFVYSFTSNVPGYYKVISTEFFTKRS